MGYSFKPITIKDANEFVGKHHRHNGPVQGGKFAVSLIDAEGRVVGVGIAGRPPGRLLDDGWTLEITRVCALEACKNVSSMLYSRLKKIGQLMGYRRFITYTLTSESGASLRAVGAVQSATVTGGGWDRKGRPRQEREIYGQKKIRWDLDPPPS
jgi:hypothetical protein